MESVRTADEQLLVVLLERDPDVILTIVLRKRRKKFFFLEINKDTATRRTYLRFAFQLAHFVIGYRRIPMVSL